MVVSSWLVTRLIAFRPPEGLGSTLEFKMPIIWPGNSDWLYTDAQARAFSTAMRPSAAQSRSPTPTGAPGTPDVGWPAHRPSDPEIRSVLGFGSPSLSNTFTPLGRALGYAYEEGAVIADGTVAPYFNSRYYARRPTDLALAFRTCGWTETER